VEYFAQVSQMPFPPAREQDVLAETEVIMGAATDMEEQVTAARVKAEEKQSSEANIAYKAISAKYR
jgi:hypothetical protein